MVIPRSRSALSLSKTQAYLKEPLPIYKGHIVLSTWFSQQDGGRQIGKAMIWTTYFLGFLLELLDGTLVNTSAFVNQMASSGRFTGVDVTDDDDVDVNLFLAHGGLR